MGRHIFVVMATIALFGRARRRGVGLRHKKVRHACTGLGAGGSYGSGMGGSSIDGGGLSAGGGGVAGSTGPALTPGTWFVSQGDPWLHAFCAADRGRGFTSSDGLRRSLLRCVDAASTTQDKGATD